LIGLAALTRPEVIILVPIVGLAMLLGSRAELRERVQSIAVVGVVALVVVAPWVVRNLATFDEPVFLASGHGSVLEVANCDRTYSGTSLGYWDIRCITDKRPPKTEEDLRLLNSTTVPGLSYLLAQQKGDESIADVRGRDAALDYMGDHLDRVPIAMAARVGRVWEVFRPFQGIELDTYFERRGLWPSRAGLAAYYVLAALAVWQLIAMRRKRVPIWPMVSMLLMVTAAVAISIGITRYRVAGDVVLAVLGGVAINALWQSATTHVQARRAIAEAPPAEPPRE
jgi:type IV secretory pathway VirB3-like protein